MKTLHLFLIMFAVIIFLGFGLKPAHAEDANGISVQNIKVQPSMIKVGDAFTVTVTIANNSIVPIVLEGGTCVPVIENVPLFTVTLDNHSKIKAKNLTCAGVGLYKILNPGEGLTGTSPDSTLNYIATESGTANVTVAFSYHVSNQTDPTQPNIEQTVSKSLLFTIYDNNAGTKTVTETVLSPLKQFESGIIAVDVKCNQGLQLIFKAEDSSPACVKTNTAFSLSALGWGYLPSPFITKTDLLNSTISGGKIKEFQYDLQSASIIIKIETVSNGSLIITIPKFITDLNPFHKPFKDFHTVLVDGMEENVDLVPTANGSIFTIPFTNGTQEIEIIGNQVGQQS